MARSSGNLILPVRGQVGRRGVVVGAGAGERVADGMGASVVTRRGIQETHVPRRDAIMG